MIIILGQNFIKSWCQVQLQNRRKSFSKWLYKEWSDASQWMLKDHISLRPVRPKVRQIFFNRLHIYVLT